MMKKSITIGVAVAAVLLAAMPFVLKYVQRKSPLESPSDDGIDVVVTDGADTQFVRTNGGYDNVDFPMITVIRSVQELTAYYEQNKTVFDLERNEDGSGFLDACEAYDDAYFADRILVLLILEEGSGSIRHEVTRVALTSEEKLEIDVTATAPYAMTADMAQWHLFIQPAVGVDVDGTDAVEVNRTYRFLNLTRECGTNVYCGNTQTTVIFEDGTSTPLPPGDSVTVTELLRTLPYDASELYKTMVEYRVETEFGTYTYGVNLTEKFARCEKGQATLTEDQLALLREIFDNAQQTIE